MLAALAAFSAAHGKCLCKCSATPYRTCTTYAIYQLTYKILVNAAFAASHFQHLQHLHIVCKSYAYRLQYAYNQMLVRL